MDHTSIWRALENLAAENGLSVSGLARRAGLDPTTFNLSKRRSADGRLRWPSTESLARVLDATDSSLEAFAALVSGARALPSPGPAGRRIPLIGLAQAGMEGLFTEGGAPMGAGWREIAPPEIADPHAYALAVAGDALEPVFRDGDTVIASPAAPIRRGDRVAVRLVAGDVLLRQLARRSARRMELRSLNPAERERSFDLTEIAWTHRIVWASQ